jgi:hypothetical protein
LPLELQDDQDQRATKLNNIVRSPKAEIPPAPEHPPVSVHDAKAPQHHEEGGGDTSGALARTLHDKKEKSHNHHEHHFAGPFKPETLVKQGEPVPGNTTAEKAADVRGITPAPVEVQTGVRAPVPFKPPVIKKLPGAAGQVEAKPEAAAPVKIVESAKIEGETTRVTTAEGGLVSAVVEKDGLSPVCETIMKYTYYSKKLEANYVIKSTELFNYSVDVLNYK